jgi:hypothetical protein
MEDRSMTGTPLDLTSFGGLLKGIGLLYWIAALGCVGLALWWFKRWWLKLSVAAAILAMFIVPAAQHVMQTQQQYDAAKAKLDAATAHFEMRCKSAGEKITRTVENVEGVVWMKWRPKYINESEQFKLEDPYGHDCGEADCIEQLLRINTGLELDPKKEQPRQVGYRFVESIDPADKKAYRYTLNLYRPHDRDPKWLETLVRTELLKQPVDRPSARYGITWDDISTREDREKWIAGGSLKVIDLQTNEVLAQRVGYMLDRSQGEYRNGPTPWGMAKRTACPPLAKPDGTPFYSNRHHQFLFEKVLKPAK